MQGSPRARREASPRGVVPGSELEGQKLVHVQAALLVLFIEVVISNGVPAGIHDAELDELLGPEHITVDGQEGVIEVK